MTDDEIKGIARGYGLDGLVLGFARALLAAQAASPDKWQPIETAPKDAWILIAGEPCRTSSRHMVVRADGPERWESADDGNGSYINPTHWQPLPAALDSVSPVPSSAIPAPAVPAGGMVPAHPDPAINFVLEVDAIEQEIVDRKAGLPATMDLAARIDRAMQFRVGGDCAAIAAKRDLRLIEAAFKAAAQAASPARQEDPAGQAGYVLVPVEPTPEMSAAGFAVSEAEHDPAGVYRAMLAASPKPGQALQAEPLREALEALETCITLTPDGDQMFNVPKVSAALAALRAHLKKG